MKDATPQTIHLKDYREPAYWISKTQLNVDLFEGHATVTASLDISRHPEVDATTALVLDGQELELVSLALNGRELSANEYSVDEETLTIKQLEQQNTLVCVTKIKPQENTSLEGLYRSRTMFCTQCEAEGFRKITYYLDRPDVMSEFVTKITADKTQFPNLLSNGNLIESGDLDGGRHFAVWYDPFKKPSYLFALVAGNLACVNDVFVTCSGREIQLRLYVEEKDLDKCDHAMTSLKKSMKWDEDVYGREYDLDIFMIVAVDDFNMGAMENKGLNIFNTSCVLANPKTTTDAGFQRVEGVVAHEYFHNWSGNRVTCRDWFQLSLKEGFTVFRDQEFSADMGSRTVKRVEDVSMLRTMQFAEDAGPTAHPVQPSSFIEISNFYTLTIYEKGAEIVRMIHTLLGAEQFRQGSDLYFQRHDGSAATIEDFVAAMAEVSGRDFTQFMNWYRYAGTPQLHVRGRYDAQTREYSLTFKQKNLPQDDKEHAVPYVIPVSMGLLGANGSLPLQRKKLDADGSSMSKTVDVLEVSEIEQTFVFQDVNEEPVPSLMKGFSAPIKLDYPYSRSELTAIMSRDDDGFCRWDASQNLAIGVIQEVMVEMANQPAPKVDQGLIEAYRAILSDESLDSAMVALMLKLPSEEYLAELSATVDVDGIHYAKARVERKIARALESELMRTYLRLNSDTAFSISPEAIARRSLKNMALHYLLVIGSEEALVICEKQFLQASNMTDELAAFTEIVHSQRPQLTELKSKVLEQFYKKWQHESLVINLWFSVQASSPQPNALREVKRLMEHSSFDIKNPNKVRSLIGSFAMRNPVNFHSKKGDGYKFLTDQVLALNKTNPQIASRLMTPLTKWRRYDETRQNLMKQQLERVKAEKDLSKDVYEIVHKSLIE